MGFVKPRDYSAHDLTFLLLVQKRAKTRVFEPACAAVTKEKELSLNAATLRASPPLAKERGLRTFLLASASHGA